MQLVISQTHIIDRLCGFISSRQWFFKVMLPKIPLNLKDEAQLICMQYITLFPFKLKKKEMKDPMRNANYKPAILLA